MSKNFIIGAAFRIAGVFFLITGLTSLINILIPAISTILYKHNGIEGLSWVSLSVTVLSRISIIICAVILLYLSRKYIIEEQQTDNLGKRLIYLTTGILLVIQSIYYFIASFAGFVTSYINVASSKISEAEKVKFQSNALINNIPSWVLYAAILVAGLAYLSKWRRAETGKDKVRQKVDL